MTKNGEAGVGADWYDNKPRFGVPITSWRKKFAWLPHDTLDDGVVWLCWVYRRRCQLYDYIYDPYDNQWWQYVRYVDPTHPRSKL
jgi:hypothetical protein